MTDSGSSNQGLLTDNSWFGHPRQLARLFTTELWERFGYYGMRAILTLYLAKHFLFSDNVTNGLYGAFTSLVYLTPLFGGLLADRYLGAKRSVKLGAILMAAGYFGLCFGGEMAKPFIKIGDQNYRITREQGNGGKQLVELPDGRFELRVQENRSIKLMPLEAGKEEKTIGEKAYQLVSERNMFWVNIMFLSLASIIVGNGFFKPNISAIVGSLYSVGDTRRDAGFTIFYMGINLGSMISQAACPWLADNVGWWAGFLVAALGMLVAWSLFQFDGGRLSGYGEPPVGRERAVPLIYLGAILTVPLMYWLLYNTMQNAELAAAAVKEGKGILQYLASLPILGKALFALFSLSIIGIPVWAFATGSREEAQKMLVAIVLVVFSVVFWTLFEQAGSSLTLFAERNTERRLGSYEMPAGQVQIFNPLFIVIFAPIFSWFWVVLGKRGLEPSIPVKFAIGLVMVGLGFLVLVYGAQFRDSAFKVGLAWLVLAYLLHSIGELCLSPVGLSMITKLSMPKVVGLMMGVWFLSTSMAQYVGGIIAQLASVETVGGEVTNPGLALNTYTEVFWWIGIASLIAGGILFIISFALKRMMHGVR